MKPYVVGIDLGGTNTVFGIVDARGVVIASSSIKTCKYNTVDGFIEDLYVELTRLIKANDAEGKIHGIGIGAPNANYYTGMIEDAVNLPWPTPIPLAKLVSEKFGIPAIVAFGRKGGSNVAAAIVNALLYSAADMEAPSARA